MYSALHTINLPDPVVRATLTMSRITSSLFLFADNVLWLQNVGLVNVDRTKWVRISSKFWLYSILMNLIRDAYEINRILAEDRRKRACYGIPLGSSLNTEAFPELVAIKKWVMANKSVSVDTLKNVCDMWIPLAALGHVHLSPTTVGFLGTISSAAAVLQIIDFSARLSPS